MLTYLDRGGKYTHAYVEGSALQWRWGVPYDAKALVALFKSKDYFVEQLNDFFEHSVPQVNVQPNAYYWHGNQPDLYAVFLFNAADRPDLTRKWARWILDHKYGDGENGMDGNDDGGTISAWYVFASLGFYPTAGSERYELTSPLWKRAEIKAGDRTLAVTADPVVAETTKAARVRLGDRTLDRTSITHEELLHGGTLRFESK